MQHLNGYMQGATYFLCLSLMACAGDSNEAVSQKRLPKSQDSSSEIVDRPVNTESSGNQEIVTARPNGQKAATTKVFEKSSKVVAGQINESPRKNRQASYESDRVEKVCATLYAYDRNDTFVSYGYVATSLLATPNCF